MDPFGAGVPDVIRFLQKQLASSKHKWGTFNSHRSALSLILSEDIARDFRVRRFLKAISKIRPQRPKYQITWDPQIVLDYICNLGDNNKLSLLNLSRKLSCLIALISAHRLQTLHLIQVENIIFSEYGAKIYIPDPIKTSGVGRYQPLLDIPFFKENPLICPALTLLEYIHKTAGIRSENNLNFLFITSKKPYSRATKATIARWITGTLKTAGLDIGMFNAHSTRHSSTSAAFKAGVSIDLIRKTAGWTIKSETFAKYYHRPICETGFATAVLGKASDRVLSF